MYSPYRKGRQSPPPPTFRPGYNTRRRPVPRRLKLVTLPALLVLVALVYYFGIDLPSFHLSIAPHRFHKSCKGYTFTRPFVPLNTTWRDVHVKHELDRLLVLSSSASKIPRIQYNFPQEYSPSSVQAERQAEIKEIFSRTWGFYREKAWLRDELKPVNGEWTDRYGGWGATLVDNLDTLWIMGLQHDFEEAVNASITIDFNDPSKLRTEDISIFETTIRFLGGFLTAYELSDCKDVRLLDKAAELADMISVAFDTDYHVPTNSWHPVEGLKGMEQYPQEDDNILANVASLSVEFTRLSQLTADMRYFTFIQGLTDRIEEQQPKTRLPGMWPMRYNARKFDFTSGSEFSLGAESDSAYEYLLKMVLLLGQAEPSTQYENMYRAAMETAIDKVLFRPMTPDNLDILMSGKFDTDDPPALAGKGEHLACFLGGMFALGGKVLDIDEHVTIGRKLTEGCVWAYDATKSGIAPEKFELMPCESKSSCTWDEERWRSRTDDPEYPKGMVSISDPAYHGRPEALESVFYMYRITGDTKWQDIGWRMFQSAEKATRHNYGNAKIQTVLEVPSVHEDFMESFWMAETLKYTYLLFSDPNEISLDDYVFSTEAHPLRIPKP